jgi:hypothetical protein
MRGCTKVLSTIGPQENMKMGNADYVLKLSRKTVTVIRFYSQPLNKK